MVQRRTQPKDDTKQEHLSKCLLVEGTTIVFNLHCLGACNCDAMLVWSSLTLWCYKDLQSHSPFVQSYFRRLQAAFVPSRNQGGVAIIKIALCSSRREGNLKRSPSEGRRGPCGRGWPPCSTTTVNSFQARRADLRQESHCSRPEHRCKVLFVQESMHT